MNLPGLCRALSLAVAVIAFAASLAVVVPRLRPASYAAQSRDPWSPNDVMTPEALAGELEHPRAARSAGRPAIVCVGMEVFYQGARVPGALYLGPGREAKGIEALTRWARDLGRDREVVLYCGCCPWTQCPNIRPAYRALHSMGLTQVKVVEIDQDFAHDWVAKGYPVEKGK